jgi:hypothetical protein
MAIRLLSPHSCPNQEEPTWRERIFLTTIAQRPVAQFAAQELAGRVRGSRSMVKISAGHLKRPRSRSQAARTAATRPAASPAAPRSATTKATGRSPNRGSGTPTTAQSQTPGVAPITRSISCGYTLTPPR